MSDFTVGKLKRIYDEYGELFVFVRKDGIEKPAIFKPIHSSLSGYYWEVVSIDDQNEIDKHTYAYTGNKKKCVYPQNYVQDTTRFVETNTNANYSTLRIYCNGKHGDFAPCFTEFEIKNFKLIFYENEVQVKAWRDRIYEQQKQDKERKWEYQLQASLPDVALPLVRRSYPALMADYIKPEKPDVHRSNTSVADSYGQWQKSKRRRRV